MNGGRKSRRVAASVASGRPPARPARGVVLRPGDLVVVRPIEEIRETLDADGRCNGIAFAPGMAALSGEAFWVVGRVPAYGVGPDGKPRRLRERAVHLEGVYHGERPLEDRYRPCEHAWRETWLERFAEGRLPGEPAPGPLRHLAGLRRSLPGIPGAAFAAPSAGVRAGIRALAWFDRQPRAE